MKASYFFLFFIWGITNFSFSQNLSSIDSLKQLAANQSGEEQVNTFNLIAESLLETDLDEALSCAKKAFNIATKINYQSGQIKAINHIGWYYLYSSQPDSAKFYLRKALKIEGSGKDIPTRINSLTGLSQALSELMQFDTAILVLNEALNHANEINSTKHIANVYAVLGNTYGSMRQTDTAISLYFTARNFYKAYNNQSDEAVMYNNIATILMDSDKHSEALKMVEEAIEINEALDNTTALLMNQSNLAICYKALGQPEKAKTVLMKNIARARENNLISALAINFNSLGNTLSLLGSYSEARQYFDSSLAICETMGIDYGILLNISDIAFMYQETLQCDSSLLYFKKAYKKVRNYDLKHEQSKIVLGLYKCYKNQDSYDSALYYYEKYMALNDTLRKMDVNQKIAELDGKYKQEKNLAKIASLNENIYREKSTHRLNIIFISAAFFLILLYLVIRRSQLRNKLLQAQITETENANLETELQARQKELAIKAMHMAHLNEQSLDLSLRLKDVTQQASGNTKEKIAQLIKDIDKASPKNAWKEFETRFENVHNDFFMVLTELHPELSPTEIKICSLIRLNMSSKDIAVLTNRSIRTIETTRSHIRKKLNLKPKTTLTGYLLSI